jgi:hypothetical protein
MMWDPSINGKEVINEFLAGYYGPGADFITNYMAFLHGAVAQSTEVCVGWGGDNCLNIGCK